MKKNCVNCGKEFEAYNHKRSGGRSSYGKRPSTSVTCSSRCSKEHVARMRREYSYNKYRINKIKC